MIEKMLKKFEELRMRYFLTIANGGNEKLDFAYGYIGETIDRCKAIVQEVAKEYGKDTNVRSNGWIPCSERLPEDNQSVLVITKTGTIWTAFYDTFCETWIDNVTDNVLDVIAWMPLPAPYQKGE